VEYNNVSDCKYGIWSDNTNSSIFRYNNLTKGVGSTYQLGMLQNCFNNSAINNTLYGGGIIISTGGMNTTLRNNTIILDNLRAQFGLYIWNNYPTTHDIDESNTINGKPIKYYKSVSNMQPDITGYSEVLCANCSNVTFRNADLYGLHILYSSNITVRDLTSISKYGIYFDHSLDNEVHGVTLKSDVFALGIEYTNNTKIYNSIVESNSTYALYLWETYNNLFYNNLFNVSSVYFDGTNINYWNTTRQTGTRIYSAGTEIGGNYWTNATGNGYSDTCTDADKDGFCDDPYVLATDNVDYLALSDEYPPPTTTLQRLSESSPISALIVVVVLCIAPALWFMREFLTSTELGPVDKLIRVILVMLALIASMILLAQFFSII
jgi:hypothetical protein